MSEENKAIIQRYCADIWNRWDSSAVDELISPDIVFRDSLGLTVREIDGFRGYVSKIRAAFPDFHNSVEDLVAEGNLVAARLSYQGTHRGEIFSLHPTGQKATYSGIAIFRVSGDQIEHGWVMGDAWVLYQQLLEPEDSSPLEGG